MQVKKESLLTAFTHNDVNDLIAPFLNEMISVFNFNLTVLSIFSVMVLLEVVNYH